MANQVITILSGNNKAIFSFKGDNAVIKFDPAIKTKIENATEDEKFVNNIAAILFKALTGEKGGEK